MRILSLCLATILLSGCYTPINVLKETSKDDLNVYNVESVTVSYSQISAEKIQKSDEERAKTGKEKNAADEIQYWPLKRSFETVTLDHLNARDKKTDRHAAVKIEIDTLKLANPVMTVLTGDTDQLAGTASIYDIKSNTLISEFYVDIIDANGGLLGLAIRGAGVRERLGLQFASKIGDQLGFDPIKAPPAPKGNSN